MRPSAQALAIRRPSAVTATLSAEAGSSATISARPQSAVRQASTAPSMPDENSHSPLASKTQSKIFTTHILLSTIGVAALLIGVAFNALAWMQDRSLKSKQRGRTWEWIPSLSVCKSLSYRALAIGFSIYTLGLLTGILWSYRTTAELVDLRVKQVGAIVAWVLFATLLQSYIGGVYRGKRTMVISACAVVAVAVAILGIRHA